MTKEELEAAAAPMLGDVQSLDVQQVKDLLTIHTYCFDVLLNELEERGELEINEGTPTVPYECDYMVETALTRPLTWIDKP
jgi:hypothetical protein